MCGIVLLDCGCAAVCALLTCVTVLLSASLYGLARTSMALRLARSLRVRLRCSRTAGAAFSSMGDVYRLSRGGGWLVRYVLVAPLLVAMQLLDTYLVVTACRC